MIHITTCTSCSGPYEAFSEEEANSPERICNTCHSIEAFKNLARRANKEGDPQLHNILAVLDTIWNDDHAAMAFYTELEREGYAPQDAEGSKWIDQEVGKDRKRNWH